MVLIDFDSAQIHRSLDELSEGQVNLEHFRCQDLSSLHEETCMPEEGFVGAECSVVGPLKDQQLQRGACCQGRAVCVQGGRGSAGLVGLGQNRAFHQSTSSYSAV